MEDTKAVGRGATGRMRRLAGFSRLFRSGDRESASQALASALYLFFYYLGSSVVGWLCGVLWAHGGWPGVVALLAGLLATGLLVALRLRRLAPVATVLEPQAA